MFWPFDSTPRAENVFDDGSQSIWDTKNLNLSMFIKKNFIAKGLNYTLMRLK